MCVAIPGIVVSVDGEKAKVDVRGNTCDVDVRLIDTKPGDYVLIHAGCALEIMKEETYRDLVEMHELLEEVTSEGN